MVNNLACVNWVFFSNTHLSIKFSMSNNQEKNPSHHFWPYNQYHHGKLNIYIITKERRKSLVPLSIEIYEIQKKNTNNHQWSLSSSSWSTSFTHKHTPIITINNVTWRHFPVLSFFIHHHHHNHHCYSQLHYHQWNK